MTALVRWEAPAPVQKAERIEDFRFRSLLGREQWDKLPVAVRRRFAKRLAPGQSVTYRGMIESCEMNLLGWLLAQASRLIGAPLPLDRKGGMAAVVTVTEDAASGGQVWSRLYARRSGFPQVIHSAKRFAGPTNLEEYLGGGFGIALKIAAIEEGIRFTSDHYFVRIGARRMRLPDWVAPGRLTIEHRDLGGGQFSFTLGLRHRFFGELLKQVCKFRDE